MSYYITNVPFGHGRRDFWHGEEAKPLSLSLSLLESIQNGVFVSNYFCPAGCRGQHEAAQQSLSLSLLFLRGLKRLSRGLEARA